MNNDQIEAVPFQGVGLKCQRRITALQYMAITIWRKRRHRMNWAVEHLSSRFGVPSFVAATHSRVFLRSINLRHFRPSKRNNRLALILGVKKIQSAPPVFFSKFVMSTGFSAVFRQKWLFNFFLDLPNYRRACRQEYLAAMQKVLLFLKWTLPSLHRRSLTFSSPFAHSVPTLRLAGIVFLS